MRYIALEQLHHKTIAVLGYGAEGKSTVRFLKEQVPGCRLQVADRNEQLPNWLEQNGMTDVTAICGEDYLQQLAMCQPDVVFKSPGVPMKVIDHLFAPEQITSQTHLFLLLLRKRIVGITGTKGKTTTAHLLHTALCAGGADAVLVGNMGNPVLDALSMDHPERLYVFEMSSHMLENTWISPCYAILLNIHEEHLDHYRSFQDYWHAKRNILSYQSIGDFALLGHQAFQFLQDAHAELWESRMDTFQKIDATGVLLEREKSGIISVKSMPAVRMPQLRILGEHNRENAMYAYVMAMRMLQDRQLLWDADTVLTAMASFPGVPHRLEYVGSMKGIDWYNDSISTIPQATICAVAAIPQVKTLILGGMDRGIDYTELMRLIQSGAVENLVMMPDTGHLLADRLAVEAVSGIPLPANVTLYRVANLEEAVTCAAMHTPKGHACVLSPAAASYGFFRNFEDRGDCFKTFVNNLGSRTES